MATLTMDVQTNAPAVLSKAISYIDTASSKAEKLKRDFSNITLSVKFDSGLDQLKKFDSVANTFARALPSVLSNVAGLASSVFTYFTSVNSQFEQMNIMLTTATGSAEGGKRIFKELIELSNKAPFSIDAITDSYIKLKSAGFDDVITKVRVLSDSVAAFGGNSDKLKLVTVAMMQMAGKGVISMEELKRQFGEQVPTAIRIMEAELKRTGKLAKDMNLADAIKKGMVGALTGTTALIEGLNKAYEGLGEKRMDSFQGAVQRLENQFKLMVKDVGDGEGAFKSISSAILAAANMIEKFRTSAEGMAVIESLSKRIAEGFQKIAENPEAIYHFFTEIGRLAEIALKSVNLVMKAIGGVMSNMDMFSGKVSISAMSMLPSDMSMDKYPTVRGNLLEFTQLQDKVAKGYIKISEGEALVNPESMFSMANEAATLSGVEQSSLDNITKANERMSDLTGTLKEGVPFVDLFATGVKKAASEIGASGKDINTLVDGIGKGAKGADAGKKALSGLSQETRKYTNDAQRAIKEADKWLQTNKKTLTAMEDLSDKFSSSGFSQGEKDIRESNKEFEKGSKVVADYAETMATVQEQINKTSEAYAAASAEYEKMQGKFGANSSNTEFDDENKTNALRSKKEELAAILKEQQEFLERMKTLQSQAITSDAELAVRMAATYKDKYFKEAYSSIGAATTEMYDYFAALYQKDAEAFEKFTGSKELAQLALTKNMRDLNDRAMLDWVGAVERGLDRAVEEAENTGQAISSAIESAFDKATDALTEFIMTGKMGFNDLVTSIASSLTKIYVQENITSPLAALIKNSVSESSGGSTGGDVMNLAGLVKSAYNWATGSSTAGGASSGTDVNIGDFLSTYGGSAAGGVSSAYLSASVADASAWSSLYSGAADVSPYVSASADFAPTSGSSAAGSATSASSSAMFSGALTALTTYLQTKDVTRSVATGAGAWAGAEAGAAVGTYVYPGVGTVIGGAVGAILGALGVGALFGDEEPPEFGFQDSVVNEASAPFSKQSGFDSNAVEYDPNFNETAKWVHPIFSAYSTTAASIQDEFNKQLISLSEDLPEKLKDLMLDNLAATDFKAVIAGASGGKWNGSEVEAALTGFAQQYSDGLATALGNAYRTALGDYITSEGAAGLLKDSTSWQYLTDSAKNNIENEFKRAAGVIKGGDIDGGLGIIDDITAFVESIASAMAPIQEVIDTEGMTEYELALRSTRKEYAEYAEALRKSGVDLSKYPQLAEAEAIALRKITDGMLEPFRTAITDMDSSGLSDFALGMREIAEQAATFKENLDSSGIATPEDYSDLTAWESGSKSALLDGITSSMYEDLATNGLSDFGISLRALNANVAEITDALDLARASAQEYVDVETWKSQQIAALLKPTIDGIDEVLELSGLSDYQKSIREVNNKFSDIIDTLVEGEQDLTRANAAWALSIKEVQDAAKAPALKASNEIIDTNGLDGYALQLYNLDILFDEYINTVTEAGGTIQELTTIEEARVIKLGQLLKSANTDYDNSLTALATAEQNLADVRLGIEKKLLSDLATTANTALANVNTALTGATTALNKAFSTAQDSITRAYNDRKDLLNDQLNTAKALFSELRSLADSFSSAIGKMSLDTDQYKINKRESAQLSLQEALFAARAGNLDPAKNLGSQVDTLTSSDKSLFGTSEDYQRDFWKAYSGLSELSVLTGDKATIEERSVALLESQVESNDQWYESQRTLLTDQLNAILGVDSSVLSIEDAISQYGKALSDQATAASVAAAAQLDVDRMTTDAATLASDKQLTAAEDAVKLAKDNVEIARAARDLVQGSYDAAVEHYGSIGEQTGAIGTSLNGYVAAFTPAAVNVEDIEDISNDILDQDYDSLVMQESWMYADMANSVAIRQALATQISATYNVASSVYYAASMISSAVSAAGQGIIAAVSLANSPAPGIGISGSFAGGIEDVPYDMVAQIHKGERVVPAAYNNDRANYNVVEAIDNLIKATTAVGTETAKNTRKMVSIIDTWDGDGMPEVRV